MPKRVVPGGLGTRINLGLLVFVLVLGVSTAGLLYWGFDRTQSNAVESSQEGLEAEGEQLIRTFTSLQAGIGALQLQPAQTIAELAARDMYALAERGVTREWDPGALEQAGNGSLQDLTPGREVDVVLIGDELTPLAQLEFRDSAILDVLFPQLLTATPRDLDDTGNFQPVAIFYTGTTGATRYYPSRGDYFSTVDVSTIEYGPLMEGIGPERNPERRGLWTSPYEDDAGLGLVISAYVPVYDGDEFRGVIGVDLSVERLSAQVDGVTVTETGFAFYLDSAGELMETQSAATLRAEIAAGNSGVVALLEQMQIQPEGQARVRIDGRDTLVAFSELPGVGGSFAVAAPVDELTARSAVVAEAIEEQADRTVGLILLMMGGLFACALAASAWITRRQLVAPIADLVRGTRRIAAGNFDTEMHVRAGAELGELSDSFNAMARDLKARNEQLTLEMAEREQTATALAERDQQYRAMFDATTDAIFITDPAYQIVGANPAAIALVGYSLEELRALEPLGLIDPGSRQATREFTDAARGLGDIRAQTLGKRKDGSTFVADLVAKAFTSGGEEHVLIVVRDITDQVDRERELERRVEQRTAELAALTIQQEGRVRQLEAVARISSSFTISQTTPAMLSDLAREVVGSTSAVACTVTIVDPGEVTHLRMAGTAGLPPAFAPAMERAYREGAPSLTLAALASRQTGIIRNARATALADERYADARASVAEAEWDTLLNVPIVYQDQALGMLVACYLPAAEPDDDEVSFVQAIADQAAVAMQNARLFRQASSAAALEERQKLARELHDSVSQALYGIGLGARTARRRLGPDGPPDIVEPVDYVLDLAEAGLTEMRALIFELRPESLELEGLVAAVKRQVAATQARHGLEIGTDLEEEPPLSLAAKEALYRIIQEALHNTVKHAKASSARVAMKRDDASLVVEVSDNGVGFDAGGDFPGHLGLKSMHERAVAFGGSLLLTSSPGQGTAIRIIFELPDPPAAGNGHPAAGGATSSAQQ